MSDDEERQMTRRELRDLIDEDMIGDDILAARSLIEISVERTDTLKCLHTITYDCHVIVAAVAELLDRALADFPWGENADDATTAIESVHLAGSWLAALSTGL